MCYCQQNALQTTPKVNTGSSSWPAVLPETLCWLNFIELMLVKDKIYILVMVCMMYGWPELFPYSEANHYSDRDEVVSLIFLNF